MISTQLPSPGRPRVLRAQLAVDYAFLVAGLGTGIWATHIPVIQARLQIDPAILGIAIFTMAIASVITMPLAGVALGKLGSRPPTGATMIAFTLFLPLPLLAGTLPPSSSPAFSSSAPPSGRWTCP